MMPARRAPPRWRGRSSISVRWLRLVSSSFHPLDAGRRGDDGFRRLAREESGLYNAGVVADPRHNVGDVLVRWNTHVEDAMSLVGYARRSILHAKNRLQSDRRKPFLQDCEREGSDFHRQRAGAEALHQLRVVGDDDEARGCLFDDLLAQKRAATPLDQAQIRIDLVRAVDRSEERR